MTDSQPFADQFAEFRSSQPGQGEAEALGTFAGRLFAQQAFAAAAWYAARAVAVLDPAGGTTIDDLVRAADYCYAAADYRSALAFTRRLVEARPDDVAFVRRHGLDHMLDGKVDEAERWFLRALELDGEDPATCDALAHLYGLRGDPRKVTFFGTRALRLKDAEAFAPDNLRRLEAIVGAVPAVSGDVPRFDPSRPERNVIAFSLWGDAPKYLRGAVLNATVAPFVYPGWRCRFYCDTTVPEGVREALRSHGADVRILERNTLPYFGLFWRFFVADDPEVDRYLIRDCDCVLNCQERTAVDQWIESRRHFHVMRDYASHTELIHAGLWGGVRGAVPNMSRLVVDYYDHNVKERTVDQRFLRHYVWPLVKQSYLCHDSHFDFDHPRRFPALGRYPKGTGNVGMNWQFLQPTASTSSPG